MTEALRLAREQADKFGISPIQFIDEDTSKLTFEQSMRRSSPTYYIITEAKYLELLEGVKND